MLEISLVLNLTNFKGEGIMSREPLCRRRILELACSLFGWNYAMFDTDGDIFTLEGISRFG